MPAPSSRLPTWLELRAHHKAISGQSLRQLFAQDSGRFQRFSRRFEEILVDFSKNHITDQTLFLLLQLAREAELPRWIDQLFSGERINHSEQRPALHVALRADPARPYLTQGRDVMPDVRGVLQRLRQFSEGVRSGRWRGATGKAVRHVVNIGIGGSELGPRLACEALAPYGRNDLTMHFAASVDAAHLRAILAQLDPETTLFIVTSKSFTTQETLTNATTARSWLVSALGEAAVAHHFVAVSSNLAAARAFGIHTDNTFGFWDWVGGRYSLWSAVGLPVIIYVGMERFEEMLAGARAMDNHFRHTPLDDNLPVLLALLGVWYVNFFNAQSQAVLVYDDYLRSVTGYLQQLEMESNGKGVDRQGERVSYATGPVLWGGLGNNGQHAYYQLLHQGTHYIPADFLAAAKSQTPIGDHHAILLANAVAQAEALMRGKSEEEARQELEQQGLSGERLNALLPYKVFAGNRPSNFILYRRLTPRTLGSLLALYEHKVFVQGILWNINSFDQWGVELGKQLADKLLPELKGERTPSQHDCSTLGLVEFLRAAAS